MADTTAAGDGNALTGTGEAPGQVDLSGTRLQSQSAFTRFRDATEIDARLVGMVAALFAIWLGFHFYGELFGNGGFFLTSRNLWNLTVQTASIGIMATGMVLVIVTRHIDLSVGSLLGLCAMAMGVFQVQMLPEIAGYGASWAWAPTILVGLLVGTLVGAFHGYLIAYLKIPAFIVTLGGLLVWNGVAYLLARGETLPFTSNVYKSLGGGGLNGSVGATWSWIIGLACCAGIVALVFYARRQRARFGFRQKPVWGDWTLIGLGCAAVVGFVLLVNSYTLPRGLQRQLARAEGIDMPEGGLDIAYGFAIPVLILLAVGIIMTFLATKTRFGRYVFAIGGNPEAAELAGINTRWVTLKIFALMGFLCGLSAVVASARLGSATNQLGQLDELYVIAAAVIGGTSLAGGLGTIYGAIIGALLMQSLQTGMVLVGFDVALQRVVVGSVLVVAVFIDTYYRRRTA